MASQAGIRNHLLWAAGWRVLELCGDGVCRGVRPCYPIAPAMFGGIERLVSSAHDCGEADFAVRYGEANADCHTGRHIFTEHFFGCAGQPKLFRAMSSPAVPVNPAAAVPLASGKRFACQTASRGMKGQEQRDQMQLCMAQARLDCIKQGIADALALLLPGARDTATFPSKRMTRPPANGCGQKSRFEKLEPPV
jgi:hypothetical protein